MAGWWRSDICEGILEHIMNVPQMISKSSQILSDAVMNEASCTQQHTKTFVSKGELGSHPGRSKD